ncbi:hypothetical protein ASPNIDRAFT_120847, partial [Aspergillus niger ATCC 1015]
LEPAPGIRFSARRDIFSGESQAGNEYPHEDAGLVFDDEVFAHKAGVNVLAIDHYEGRLYVTPILCLAPINDNRVILFDIRRGGHNSAIAALDMDDAVGLVRPGSIPASYQSRPAFSPHARAHNGAVTGVRWTSSGSHLVTAGQDSRIRVWDAGTGANTLVHFGQRVRNSVTSHLAERAPLIIPRGMVIPGQETLLWPNFNERDDRGEIFMFELREGAFVKLLRVPGLMTGRQQFQGRSSALSAARINALAWRGNGSSGEGIEMYSAHGDGTIRTWASREPEEPLISTAVQIGMLQVSGLSLGTRVVGADQGPLGLALSRETVTGSGSHVSCAARHVGGVVGGKSGGRVSDTVVIKLGVFGALVGARDGGDGVHDACIIGNASALGGHVLETSAAVRIRRHFEW